MATVGELVVDLRASTASFASDLGKAKSLSFNTAKEIERSFNLMGTAIGAAAAAAATSLVYMTGKAIDTADEMGKLAQRTGLTVEQFSGLSYAAKLADIDTGTLAGSLVILSKNLEKSSQATLEGKAAHSALATLFRGSVPVFESTDEAFTKIAQSLSELPDGYQKTALAAQIFGRSGAQLIPLLNEGAAGIGKLRGEAAQLGVVISTETAKNAQEFEDNVKRIGVAAEGVGLKLAESFLPFLKNLSGSLTMLTELNARLEEADRKAAANNGFRDRRVPIPATAEMRDVLAGLEGIRVFTPEADTEAGQKAIEALREELQLLKMIGPEAAKQKAIWKAAADGANTSEQALIGNLARRLELQKQLLNLPMPRGKGGFTGIMPDAQPPQFPFEAPDIDLKALGLEAEKLPPKFDEIRSSVAKLSPAIQQVRQDASSMFTQAIFRADNFRDAMGRLLERIAEVIFQTQVMDRVLGSAGSGGSGILGTIVKGIFGGLTHGVGKIGDVVPTAPTGVQFAAAGGFAMPGQPFIVGEKGPELFVPDSAGSIVPNNMVRAGRQQGGGDHFHIDARGADAGVEQRLRRWLQEEQTRTVVRSVAAQRDLNRRRKR